MVRRTAYVTIALLLFMTFLMHPMHLGAQETTGMDASSDQDSGSAPGRSADIPREYRGIRLGMAPDDVKSRLSEDPWFDFRGDPDISMLERPRASLIDAGGSLFIARGLFQFEEEALATIMLELEPTTIDWFTVYTALEDKYGPPTDMTPARAWWEDRNTRLALERPLTVKYLDLGVLGTAAAEEEDRRAWRETAREEFLGEF